MPVTRSGRQLVVDQGSARPPENGAANGSAKQRGKVAADTAADQSRQVASTARSQGQQVAGAAKQQARDVTATVKEQAAQFTQELSVQGRSLYEETREQVEHEAETQTQQLAVTLRRLGTETQALADGRPEAAGSAGEYAGQLADKLHDLATGLENRGVSGLIEEVQDFARRRPGAFLLSTVIVGFAGGRLLRSAKSDSDDDESSYAELPPAPAPPRRAPTGPRRVARTSRNPASSGGE
jgi:gas vesicle protein